MSVLACFGPLEVAYDKDAVRQQASREVIEARPPGLWRYLEFLPVDAPPARGLRVGSTPLLRADRLGPALGIDRLWLKDDTRNPTLSFKDRAVAVAAAQARLFGIDTLACASTGNLAGATAAAAAALGHPGLRVHPGRPRASQDRPRARLRRDGRPDRGHVRRRQPAVPRGRRRDGLGLRQREPPSVLRRGQQDPRVRGRRRARLAIARRHRRADRVGGDVHEAREGFRRAGRRGLIERRPIRFVGGQAAGCAPVATAWEQGTTDVQPVRTPDTFVRSLAIGNPADGRYSVEQANASGGSIEAIPDEVTAAAIRQVGARSKGSSPRRPAA